VKEKSKTDVTKVKKEDLPWDQLPDAVKQLYRQSIKSESSQENQPYLYLYAAMSQPEVTGIVRRLCIQDEVTDLPNTLNSWLQARTALQQIVSKEQRIADNAQTYDIADNQKLTDLKNDPLFQNTFSSSPFEFKMVDIDTLIAPQRNVYLNYVDDVEKRIPDNPSIDDLIDICLPLKQQPPEPKATQINSLTWLFSSPSSDFRFLGGYLKDQITEDDLRYTQVSGFPVKAITLFVGYGGSPINVMHANNRLVLNNGFHRVYALRRKGITRIPVVIHKIANVELEFPKQILGLTSGYLLGNPRPILVKDFFAPGLTKEFKRKKMITTVQVGANGGPITFEV